MRAARGVFIFRESQRHKNAASRPHRRPSASQKRVFAWRRQRTQCAGSRVAISRESQDTPMNATLWTRFRGTRPPLEARARQKRRRAAATLLSRKTSVLHQEEEARLLVGPAACTVALTVHTGKCLLTRNRFSLRAGTKASAIRSVAR